MADLDVRPSRAVPAAASADAASADAAAAARVQLRRQIVALEYRLREALLGCLRYADPAAFAPAFAALDSAAARRRPGPRLLDLGELEQVRDELAARLSATRAELHRRGERAERARLRLERMRLAPGRHRFARVTCAELGEGGCGVWQVRPRLGLIGMLMGWWEVKLSSGCP